MSSQRGVGDKRRGVMAVAAAGGAAAAAAAAALLSSLVAATPASAALVYDLRLAAGGGKALTAAEGSSFDVDVFAVVSGANGTATDDGYQNGFYSLLSNHHGGGTTAALSVTGGGPVTPFTTSGFQNGTTQDIDGDGDADRGKRAADSGNGAFVFSRAAEMQVGTGAGPVEFKIGTFTVQVGPGAGDASLNVALPGTSGTGTSGLTAAVNYRQDGVAGLTLANVSVGAPVVVTVPEPATLGLLAAAAGTGVLARRRRAR